VAVHIFTHLMLHRPGPSGGGRISGDLGEILAYDPLGLVAPQDAFGLERAC